MTKVRGIERILKSKPTIEGAGVHLKRAFGYLEAPRFDPFLLLDDFHSSNPADYIAGFPWHPHRGIETVTYMLGGRVEHGDSLNNSGVIEAGDIQWMTAGSGIIHQEMPKPTTGPLWGFQLWVNLPAAAKMIAPKYRDVHREEVPVVETPDGAIVRIISGRLDGIEGPVRDIVVEPEYLDVTVRPNGRFLHNVPDGHTVLVYMVEGVSDFDQTEAVGPENVVLFGEGDRVTASAGPEGARFILVAGKPIGEPVAWRGPIVMNTDEELEVAFAEYSRGTFVK